MTAVPTQIIGIGFSKSVAAHKQFNTNHRRGQQQAVIILDKALKIVLNQFKLKKRNRVSVSQYFSLECQTLI